MQGSPWHVLHVLSNHEKRVVQHLDARSVEHYLPFYAERVKWTDRTVVTERPLFPGYVFARIRRQSRIAVISIPGVLWVLGDEECNMMSAEELEKIRAGLSSGLLLRPHPNVAAGTRVRVRDGIFGGVEGVVTDLRHQCKVVVSLFALRQSFSLDVSPDSLQVLESAVSIPALNQAPAMGY